MPCYAIVSNLKLKYLQFWLVNYAYAYVSYHILENYFSFNRF